MTALTDVLIVVELASDTLRFDIGRKMALYEQ